MFGILYLWNHIHTHTHTHTHTNIKYNQTIKEINIIQLVTSHHNHGYHFSKLTSSSLSISFVLTWKKSFLLYIWINSCHGMCYYPFYSQQSLLYQWIFQHNFVDNLLFWVRRLWALKKQNVKWSKITTIYGRWGTETEVSTVSAQFERKMLGHMCGQTWTKTSHLTSCFGRSWFGLSWCGLTQIRPYIKLMFRPYHIFMRPTANPALYLKIVTIYYGFSYWVTSKSCENTTSSNILFIISMYI
jgi:hypothetical protein